MNESNPHVKADVQAETVAASVLDAAVQETMDREATRALSQLRVDAEHLRHDREIAKVMYQSGVYKDLKDCTQDEAVAKAVLKIMLGRSMGMSPMESLQSIYLVGGRPSVSSDFRASRMRRAGYSWEFDRHDEKGCVIRLIKDGKPMMMADANGKSVPVKVSFVEADAQAAGLLTRGKGDNASMYEKWGRLMYFNRVIGYAQRFHAPEVLGSDFASLEDIQAEHAAKYADDGERLAAEVAEDLKLSAAPKTVEAQEEVAARKVEALKATDQPKPEQPKPAADKPKMTFGGKA